MSTRLGLEGIVRPIGLNEERRCSSREAGGGRRLGQQETAMNAKNRFVWTAIEQPHRPDTLLFVVNSKTPKTSSPAPKVGFPLRAARHVNGWPLIRHRRAIPT